MLKISTLVLIMPYGPPEIPCDLQKRWCRLNLHAPDINESMQMARSHSHPTHPTALHMAAVKTHQSASMIHLLIAHGHAATTKNRYGWTALDFAKQVSPVVCHSLTARCFSQCLSACLTGRKTKAPEALTECERVIVCSDSPDGMQVKNQDGVEILDNKEDSDRFSTVLHLVTMQTMCACSSCAPPCSTLSQQFASCVFRIGDSRCSMCQKFRW